MIERIESLSNPLVKHIKGLHSSKHRNKYNEYILEGTKSVLEALKGNANITTIIVSDDYPQKLIEDILKKKDKNVRMVSASPEVFRKVTATVTPQGIIACIGIKQYDINSLLKKKEFFLLALDNVQDPGNIGTIIRTADAAGADGLIIIKGSADPYNPKCVRSTMGSILRVPIYFYDSIDELMDALSRSKCFTIASHVDGDNLFEFELLVKKLVVVVGNESKGLSDETINMCSKRLRIPMPGKTQSLNVSTAAGVLVYELMRKLGRLTY